ncbi:MAG TPA: hypothetical protein VL171_14590 [Verrucomicrobiae bacterium]|nr:hypothetical protein [Verrucomicrobiae bacterium]
MKIQELRVGMRVKHPQHGMGIVKTVTEHTADIRFDDATRTIAPENSELEPFEARASVSGLEMPLSQFIEKTIQAVLAQLGVERPGQVVEQLGNRWRGGRMVLHPADAALQPKEVLLDVFFHKIVMVRNNLRVLEQKINGHEKLSDAEKVEFQQYITRSYGSLTTFNMLFGHKEDQFRSGE